MILLGIDPGPTTSGVVVYDATTAPYVVASHARLQWADAREWLRAYPGVQVICERTQAGPPSSSVVLTTEVVGRVQEACDLLGHPLVLMYRREVLQALGCAVAGNKDALVRQVLIGMHGGTGLAAVGHAKGAAHCGACRVIPGKRSHCAWRIAFNREGSTLNEAEYRAHPAVNYSTLKHMRKSPLHYRHAVDNPEDSGNDYAMLRAVHALVLEPMTAHDSMAVWDGRRDKRDKAYCAFLDANAGKDILNPTEHAQAKAVAAAYSRNGTLQWLLSLPGTRCEQPHVWTHSCASIDLELKGKPDIVHYSKEHGLIVADLKTCGDTDARLVASMARKYGWLLQLAHYTLLAYDAWQLDPSTTPVRWLTISAEDKAPFDCTALEWDPASMIAACEEHAALIGRLEQCLLSDQWPGRGDLQIASLANADG